MTAESMDFLITFLSWSLGINTGLMIFWTICVITLKDFIYQKHQWFFNISKKTMDVCMYGFLGLFKLLVIFFNLVPLVALLLMK